MPDDLAVLIGMAALTVVLLWIDLKLFARGREPSFRESVAWSIGWFVLSLLVGPVLLVLRDAEAAVNFTTVYLIERSLSLDNLFVFLLLFTYFGVPVELRGRLLFWGIVAALVLRGLAILGGVALIEQFHFVLYLLGVGLLVLAWRILQGVEENVHPDRNVFVRAVRRFMPVTGEFRDGHFLVREEGGLHATPLLLAFVSIVMADIAFAIDSIPAAFAITTDALVIWMANAFALLGLRSLFALVTELIRRFRYLNQTIAGVLALVGVKLLIEDLVEIGPGVSLGIVAGAFAIGIVASLVGDRRAGSDAQPPS